jgi:hypothetical protein|tara:strand:+ start:589 stop:1149 length:561 start_codon:yes stop_codon:yes gene_type:complete
MWKLGDTVIREGKSWRDSNGVTHPQTWARWTDDEKKAAGLTFVADPKTWDNRFYWGWNADETALIERNIADVNEVDDDGNPILDQDGNQVVTLGLKSVAIARTKETAGGKLSQTDWYVTRKTEAGTAIPTAVSDYRTAVRAKSKTIEDAITACDTHAKFMALYDTPVDSSGNPTGNAPIHNWPEEI